MAVRVWIDGNLGCAVRPVGYCDIKRSGCEFGDVPGRERQRYCQTCGCVNGYDLLKERDFSCGMIHEAQAGCLFFLVKAFVARCEEEPVFLKAKNMVFPW
ncbi:hypothetical protein LR032_03820 [Candidatus Bipolaricaulota bacterium]|nr:hypothetical protein [Candidatus Bipolaricaulota bacterium]